MDRRIFSGVLMAAALTACGADRPSGLGDTTGSGGLSDSGGGSSCASPGAVGCPCSQVGETAACGEVVDKTNGFVSCSMGKSTCTMGPDGSVTWSACIGSSVVAKSVDAPGSLHVTALGTGAACPSGTNPCDPYCYSTTDTPDAGFTAPNGFVATPSGLTLSGSATVPCTGLTLTPTASSVTVTSLTATTTIGLTATATPSGCATSPYTTTWSVDQPGQATITGTNNTNGSLSIGSPLPGTINVTAYAAGTSGTVPITVKLNIIDTTGTTGDTAASSTQSGKFYSGGTTSGSPLAGTTASTATMLYPYASTYFPLGLPAPTIMYSYGATPGTSPSSAVKVSLRYPAGTTEATSTFNYATIVSESTPDPRVYILQSAWSRFEQAARGSDASLVVQRFTGGGSSGALELETSENIHFVNGQLKGTVYYTSYSSPQGNNTGAVLSIAPGATSPTLAVQPSGTCTVCHSLNLTGTKLIANGRTSSGNYSYDQSQQWDLTSGSFPSPTVSYSYTTATNGDLFTYGGARTDGSLYMTHGGTGTGDPNWHAPSQNSGLYQTANTTAAQPLTNWPSNMEAVTPRFSVDGSAFAFGFWGGNSVPTSSGTLSQDTLGSTLAVMDFACNTASCTSGNPSCCTAWTASNARALTSASTLGGYVYPLNGGSTFTVTNGSTTVTASGSSFSSDLAAGAAIVFASQPAVTYTVSSIASNTSLTLTGNFTGTSSKTALSGTNYHVTNGSKNVTATLSFFTTQLSVGSIVTFSSQSSTTYTVASITSDTALTLTANYGGTTSTTATATVTRTTSATRAPKVAWPSFVPDESAVLYQRQLVSAKAYMSWSASDINTIGGSQADIWMSNVPATAATTATPTRLNALNGLNLLGTASYLPTAARTVSPPTAFHSGNLTVPFTEADNCSNSSTASNVSDYQLNYLPTVSPTQVGGLNWVVFTSRRMYGNMAFGNPWDVEANQSCATCVSTAGALVQCSSCTIGTNCSAAVPTKKLWVSALDGTFTPGTDPSHPAFYLPGQELAGGNSNGYWVQSPCAAVGSSCTTNDDCCGGSGSSATTTCKITTAPSTKTCQNISTSCVASGGVCNTAGSPGDCCNGLTCPGAGGLCFNPSSIVYTQQTYTREFVGTCPSATKPVWRYFDWLATIPTGTQITFSAQTKQLSTDTYLPVTALGIGSATTSTTGTTWAHAANTVDTTLTAAGLVSKPYLLVTMVFTPSTGGATAPTLQAWKQEYDCVASE